MIYNISPTGARAALTPTLLYGRVHVGCCMCIDESGGDGERMTGDGAFHSGISLDWMVGWWVLV